MATSYCGGKVFNTFSSVINSTWIIDSSATDHITFDSRNISSLRQSSQKFISIVNGNQGTKFRFFRLKYQLSAGPETILPTDSWLAKKSEKNRKNCRNIGNSRYFGEISAIFRDFISRAHVLEFLKKYR